MPISNWLEAFGFTKIKRPRATSLDHAMVGGVRQDVFLRVDEDDDEYIYKPVYLRTRCSPFEVMMRQVDKMDLADATQCVKNLRIQIDLARSDPDTLVEPLHVQLVGKPRQCKTQMASRILEILKESKLLCVSRTSEDGFFDDLQKVMNVAVHEKKGGEFVFHPTITDTDERRSKCKLDVLFLDELYSKKSGANDISTILNGITPMPWRPTMADPKFKGTTHKPFLWLSTANHEVTDHSYNVAALLKRVHLRFVVENGKFYEQDCHRIIEPSGLFLGGFSTCAGRFGKWRIQKTSESTTRVVDSETGKAHDQVTQTRSSEYFEEVRDSSVQNTFLCSHCVHFKYEDLISKIADKTSEKLRLSIDAREQFKLKVEEGLSGVSR